MACLALMPDEVGMGCARYKRRSDGFDDARRGIDMISMPLLGDRRTKRQDDRLSTEAEFQTLGRDAIARNGK